MKKEEHRYLSEYPELMLDWIPELNPGLDPNTITHASHIMPLWRCHKCGREWRAQVRNRTIKTGCTCDAGIRASAKFLKQAVRRSGSLAETQPDIAALWHPTLNGNLTPNDLTESSRYKAWWIDETGNPFQASVWYITRKHGKPNPQKIRAKTGINDILSQRPDLVAEWDYEKNIEYDVSKIKVTAILEVWWKCRKGHEWKATVAMRNAGKRNCPICNQESSTSFPEQAVYYYVHNCFADALSRSQPIENMEVDVFIPSEAIAIEYDGGYYHSLERKIAADKRKSAALRKASITLIRITEEGTAAEADYVIPCYRKGSVAQIDDALNELFPLLSKLTEHKVEIDIDSKRDYQLILKQYLSYEKENSIAAVSTELLNEWHPTKNGDIKPEFIPAMSNKLLWWVCSKCGYEWRAPAYRRSKGSACPACSGRYTVSGINDLPTKRPDLMKQWDYKKNQGIDPHCYQENSGKSVWWICDQCGYEWKTLISNRSRGRKCPKCMGKVLTNSNSLLNVYPELAKQWDYEKNAPLSPADFMAGSSKKVWWRCEKGHSWQSAIQTRQRNGCPYCGSKILLKGFNDLASVHPELLYEWDYENNTFKPDEVFAGTNKQIAWICENGHRWKTKVTKRLQGTGCPYCKGKLAIKGVNDLSTTHPELMREWICDKNPDATTIKAGSQKIVWWKCTKCGHEWQASVYSRTKGRKCPACHR